jgi:hypothetical protein
VEEAHKSVLQYQLFEEVGKEGEGPKEDRKIVVHINCGFMKVYYRLKLHELLRP